MIIQHLTNEKVRVYGLEGDNQYEQFAYLVGYDKPNYPMPSIHGSITITKYAVYLGDPKGWDCVACWRHDRGQVI